VPTAVVRIVLQTIQLRLDTLGRYLRYIAEFRIEL